MKVYGPTQFAIFRIIFGIYLTVHFTSLLPYGTELFSNEGSISDTSILAGFGKMPILLFTYDSPEYVYGYLISLVIGSIMFTFGYFRRIVSLWLFYGWISLLNRNPFISNPSLAYIGWILLACTVIPKGESLRFLSKHNEATKWEMPDIIYYGKWIILGVSYMASGLHKLQCETWLNGTALWYVLTGPLVRDNIIVDIILSNEIYTKLLTWGSLFLEISFLLIGTFYRPRKTYWLMMMGFHIGILLTVNFADLTIGMIMPHLFTFDAAWFEITKKLVEKYDLNGKEIKEHDINLSDKFNTKPMKEHAKTVINKIKTISTENRTNVAKYCISTVVLCISIIYAIYNMEMIQQSIMRMMMLTIDSYWGFCFLITTLGMLMTLERIFPDQKLKKVEGWWKWVIIVNVFQLLTVILSIYTWEHWLQKTSYFTAVTGFHLRDHVSPFVGGLIAYIINQWLFYHWHKARHEIYSMWILFHQFHHSPSRIEAITSFYKHPLEIIVDSQIMAILLYSVLGLNNSASIWLSIFSGVGEYVYHMNIKTPQWMGWFFQRPESHRCHHRRNKRIHCPNYSDFPIWDILGGTYENPKEMNEPTGFHDAAEVRRLDMLFFIDVLTHVYQDIFSDYKKLKKSVMKTIWHCLIIWGTMNSIAFIVHYDGFKDMGFVSVSSPLPLVFSAYNGHETYSTEFNISVSYKNDTNVTVHMDGNLYNKIKGPYNRRNIYGAVFSHGPFFNNDKLIEMRQSVLNYAICKGVLAKEFGMIGDINDIKNVTIDVFARHMNKKVGEISIGCT